MVKCFVPVAVTILEDSCMSTVAHWRFVFVVVCSISILLVPRQVVHCDFGIFLVSSDVFTE